MIELSDEGLVLIENWQFWIFDMNQDIDTNISLLIFILRAVLFRCLLGSWNSSFIVSNTGRSRREKEAYLVDANDESYTYQTYAGIFINGTIHTEKLVVTMAHFVKQIIHIFSRQREITASRIDFATFKQPTMMFCTPCLF